MREAAPPHAGGDDKSIPALRKSASSLRCLGRADLAELSVSVRAVAAGAHRDAAESMSTLRRLALNLAKGEKSLKIGVAANERERAGIWSASERYSDSRDKMRPIHPPAKPSIPAARKGIY